jgi:hypothetical protein
MIMNEIRCIIMHYNASECVSCWDAFLNSVLITRHFLHVMHCAVSWPVSYLFVILLYLSVCLSIHVVLRLFILTSS